MPVARYFFFVGGVLLQLAEAAELEALHHGHERKKYYDTGQD